MSTYIVNSGAITGSVTIPTSSGSSGSTLTYTTGAGVGGTGWTNSSTVSWAPPNQNLVSNNGTPIMTIPHDGNTVVLEKKATLDVQGNVKINGIDLEERLETIEKVLQIPTRDITIENKYPKLAELYKQYMHELEKYKTFERIKGNDDTTTP